MEVCVGEVLEDLTHAYPEQTVHLKLFLCRLESGEPQPLGCAAIRWINDAKLAACPFPAADARLIEKLANARNLWPARA